MEEKMFCFQCEQTAGGTGCSQAGVCGKSPAVALAQDETVVALIRLARAALRQGPVSKETGRLLIEGLFLTVTNVNFDEADIHRYNALYRQAGDALGAGAVDDLSPQALFHGDQDIVSLRSTLLFGLKGMAAYADHARVLGYEDPAIYQGCAAFLAALVEDHPLADWLSLLMDFGHLNLKTMGLLDQANTESYGRPTPTTVSTHIGSGPFIVVTGHDLLDLKMLLEQTEGTGVAVYTHGEMLPAHGYPELAKYDQLKGHFGTAWNNQQAEFDNIPGALLYTTNCLMPPRPSYKEALFTTGLVAWPDLPHIEADAEGHKDFSQVIAKAKALGGYDRLQEKTGANGGHTMTTGFARDAVLAHAGTLVEAVKAGDLGHIFLVGGCDGAKPGRSYYTDFVKATPADSLVLTLACGKFRFNDLDLGTLGGLPRLMDMGQCNDAYSAIQVAVALAEAFDCGVNDLPLTLVLSWYEQKAVCILLTLLALGIKNIYVGPSLPAFFSDRVLQTLVETFDLHPTGQAEEDLAAILGA
ncbi:hydroxylamine reductase [Peptococcus simiae]|uniref:hydroxylamine reductase n=1 Tax=Peptococcus simiae TaxID=1643805 RepID=UPI0039800C32